MGIFSFKDKMFSKWSMRWKNVKYSKQSGAMKELLDKPAVAKALDRWDEQKELYDLLRSKADGGVTRQEMRQILGKLRRGGGKSIDRTEAMKIAHAIFPGRFADRYDFSETRDQGDVAQTSDISDHSAPAVESPSVVSSRHSSVGRRRLSSGATPSLAAAPMAEYRRRSGQRSPVPQVPISPPRMSKPLPNSFPTHFGAFNVKAAGLIVLLILIIMSGFWWFGTRNTQDQSKLNSVVGPTMSGSLVSDDSSQSTGARYVEYPQGIVNGGSVSNRRVLFFYASWCPFCRPADAEFRDRMSEIPGDVTVIRVNYNDSDTDEGEKNLARQYGVTYQHTFVQIDPDGTAVATWNGGKLKELLNHIK